MPLDFVENSNRENKMEILFLEIVEFSGEVEKLYCLEMPGGVKRSPI